MPKYPVQPCRQSSSQPLPMSSDTPKQPPTDFSRFVLEAIKSSTAATSPTLDQAVLRTALALASSYLLTDTSTNDPHAGSATWFVGLNRLVDLLVVLHTREELEIETVNAASKVRYFLVILVKMWICHQACSECWTAAGTWRGLEECREGVRKVGVKLKNILDENGLTYRGNTVYSPLAPSRPPPRLPSPPIAQT
ncbi:hypothetical protein B0H15DRAFT_111732 [Mycena belliarum]|uniref:Uncharacterized protein n=1 Tax=Mycena belliarum TaxID=1033014 RepID=A0AAD6UG18_9AGAR|nr:hypothetical protein B0H15DRAFT_111732 [Mycena belliae]